MENMGSNGSRIVGHLFEVVKLLKESDMKNTKQFSLDGVDGYKITFTKKKERKNETAQ